MDRQTWTLPGDRYELNDEQHWVLIAKGPRPIYRASATDRAHIRQLLARVGGPEESST